LVEVNYQERNGEMVFVAVNHGLCEFELEINFSVLTYYQPSSVRNYQRTVAPGQTQLFTLKPQPERGAPRFQYSYRYTKGKADPKVNYDVEYLLPVAPGKKTQAREVKYLGETLGNRKYKDFFVLAFSMEAGDTVFAARKGQVSDTHDQAKPNGKKLLYAKDKNYVEVYHKDGTFGVYELFKNNGIFVKPGQKIEAGEPLGIIGATNYMSGSHLRFSVFYSHIEEVVVPGSDEKETHYWKFVPTPFRTAQHTKKILNPNAYYTAIHPTALITQEMSRREIKRWKKEQKD